MIHPPSEFCSKATLDKHPGADCGLLAKCTVDEMTPALQGKTVRTRRNLRQNYAHTKLYWPCNTQLTISISPDPKFKSTGQIQYEVFWTAYNDMEYFLYSATTSMLFSTVGALVVITVYWVFTQSIHSPTPTFSS